MKIDGNKIMTTVIIAFVLSVPPLVIKVYTMDTIQTYLRSEMAEMKSDIKHLVRELAPRIEKIGSTNKRNP